MTNSILNSLGWKATQYHSIADIPETEWNLCVGPEEPLLSHGHLLALELSGIAAPENGFSPCHTVLRDAAGQITAAAAAYLKTHSKGELGVDLGLAMAHGRSVGPYYPKLQVEVPMVPFGGRRLLTHPDSAEAAAIPALLSALQDAARANGASCVQIGYMTGPEAAIAANAGYAITETSTYAWRPGTESSFEGLIARMHSRARSEIRRQRRRVADAGLQFRYFRGDTVDPAMAGQFFDLYKENFDRHASQLWLNKDYFLRTFATMRDNIELSVACDGDRWVSAVFSVVTPTKAYTQYWGQTDDIRFLHFEQVMYRGIERAYVTGLNFLDFGPTGAHKAERGLAAEAIHHAAWFVGAPFAEVAVAAFNHKSIAAQAERSSELARLPFMDR